MYNYGIIFNHLYRAEGLKIRDLQSIQDVRNNIVFLY